MFATFPGFLPLLFIGGKIVQLFLYLFSNEKSYLPANCIGPGDYASYALDDVGFSKPLVPSATAVVSTDAIPCVADVPTGASTRRLSALTQQQQPPEEEEEKNSSLNNIKKGDIDVGADIQ